MFSMPRFLSAVLLIVLVVTAVAAATSTSAGGAPDEEGKAAPTGIDSRLHDFASRVLKFRGPAKRPEVGGPSPLLAGVAKVDATLPIGVPLAGYNYPPRRTDVWPIPKLTNYTTWMTPSVGAYEPTWVKALVLDDGVERIAMVTMDVIGADGTLGQLAYQYAAALGVQIQQDNVLFSAAHTHSGPGAIGPEFLWSVAPATDVMVPAVQHQFAQSIAAALFQAESALQPALLDIGTANLTGVTHNRRAGISKYVQYGTIDPQLAVLRVDSAAAAGPTPLATVWNFAIHGICYDAPNLNFSGDVMGSVNQWVEAQVGGVSMFINADAGDINPVFPVCCNDGPNFSGGPVIGAAVQQLRASLQPVATVSLQAASAVVAFGEANLNLTLSRVANCTQGGPLDICALCRVLDCTAPIRLNSAWLENTPRFTAFSFGLRGKSVVMVSVPGEALVELGWMIYNATLPMGFDHTLIAGYSNNHLGYFAPPDEYLVGGYESLLTFFGIDTAAMVLAGSKLVAQSVAQPAVAVTAAAAAAAAVM